MKLPSKKTIALILLAVLIAAIVIVWLKIPTPITSQLIDLKNALFSLNISHITVAFWALIGGFSGAIGISGGLAYLYSQAKKSVGSLSTKLSTANQQVNTLYNQNDLLAKEKGELQNNSNTVIKQISTEKEAALTKASDTQTLLDTANAKLHDQEVAMKAVSAQAQQNFTAALPADSVITDGAGNVIKTVTQTLVK